MEKILESDDKKSYLSSSFLKQICPDIDIDALKRAVKNLKKYKVKPSIVIFGKECHQPRDIVFLSNESKGYQYSGQFMAADKFDDETKIIFDLMNSINKHFNSAFNGILINRYVNGNDHLGSHSDEESGLDPNAGVVSISFGATRTFRIRPKSLTKTIVKNQKKVCVRDYRGKFASYDVPLIDQQVVVMGGNFQSKYEHEIPAEKKVKETRFNLTFRRHVK